MYISADPASPPVRQKSGRNTSKPSLDGIKIDYIVPPPPVQPGGKAGITPGEIGVSVRAVIPGACALLGLCEVGCWGVRARFTCARRVYFLATLNGILDWIASVHTGSWKYSHAPPLNPQVLLSRGFTTSHALKLFATKDPARPEGCPSIHTETLLNW